jgi:hypothetical protein
MNLAFKKWCKSLRKIYWQASWGFDQYGDAMVSFGSPGNKDRYSQMNIELAPAQTPVAAPYLMCYPPQPIPATVGPIQRGIEEPSVGCEIDFNEAEGKGMAGFALGRRDKKHFRVMIDQAKTLAQFALAMHAGLTFSIPAAAARTARGEGVRGRTAR